MYDFTIVVLEKTYSASVVTTIAILNAAEKLASRVGISVPKWRLCSITGGSIELQSGVSVQTIKLPKHQSTDTSTWIIPGLGIDRARAIEQRLLQDDATQVIKALQKHAKAGGTIAASCSGVFVLHAAGLIKGKRVTTAWWLAPDLKKMAPDCQVDSDRMVCADGAIVTAGAAFAQTDLMLHLLRTQFSSALADIVSRILLVDGRQAQASFVVPEVFSNGDDLIGRLAARVEASLPDTLKVSDLAREFCMSERTLSRHIQKSTGKSTLALLLSVKLRRARSLLENSRMTVEQVAEAVGYQDATALRRLMKRVGGANPSRFRPSIAMS
jgi:transcriptional regulator GlxA family with amidase domain